MEYQKKKSGAGFTLVEIFVVISIIAILSGIFFVNYRQGGKLMALQRSASKLAQDIRRAQEMAIAAEECGECAPVQVPPRYGVYISNPGATSSKIFADLNDNGIYEQSQDHEISTTDFESEVNYSEVSGVDCHPSDPSGLPPGQRRIYLTFKPPDPITELLVGSPGFPPTTCSQISVTLRFGGLGGPTKSVRINQKGMIEIQ